MLDPEIAKRVLSDFRVEDRPSILDAVNLGKGSKVELETWGLFCACLMWGGIEGRKKSLEEVYKRLDNGFVVFLNNPKTELLKGIFPNKPKLLVGLCRTLNGILSEYKTIGNLVSREPNVISAIFKLGHTIWEKQRKFTLGNRLRGLPKILTPEPPKTDKEKKEQSALKKYCMFFRWMIRNEPPDLGLWGFFDKRDLFHPIDTHVARILQRWGVLSDNSPNWFNVEKVTQYFGMVKPDDPLKFDYHLVTFGQKFCKKDDPMCCKCPIRSRFNCIL